MSTQASAKANVPYCSNCGYELTGCVDSSKCPECGRPLVEVLARGRRSLELGKRYRSRSTIFGIPVIDVAFGPKNGEMKGKARGFIAIGDEAMGVLAIGGLARGVVAIGGMALGTVSLGGMSIGLLAAAGGAAIGGFAAGGGAVGGVAAGGGALGFIAQGGGAVGWFARGGGAFGVHTVTVGGTASPSASQLFDSMSWYFGAWPPAGFSTFQPFIYPSALTIAMGAIILLIGLLAARRSAHPFPPTPRS